MFEKLKMLQKQPIRKNVLSNAKVMVIGVSSDLNIVQPSATGMAK